MICRSVRGTIVALSLASVLAAAGCSDETQPITAADESRHPEAEQDSSGDPSEPEESDTAADGVDGAIVRFEEYLHALGDDDIGKLCEIAIAVEELDMGSCEEVYTEVLAMITDTEKAALTTATVDPSKVEEPEDGQVYFPQDCVVADEPLDDLGDYTFGFSDGEWFLIG